MVGLTIAVLNYAGRDILRRCLNSIVKQDIEKPYEILVIDNSPWDGEVDALRKAIKFNVRVADNEHQFITGLNTAFEAAIYDRVFFVTNDMTLDNGCIASLRFMSRRFNDAIIQPMFYDALTGAVQHAGMRLYWPMYGFALREEPEHSYEEVEIFATTGFIMTKETYRAIGPFDTKLAPGHYEDVDYSLRAKRRGYRFFVDKNAWVRHIGAHSFNSVYGKLGISKIAQKNREYLIGKHYRGLDAWCRLMAAKSINSIKNTGL